LVFNACSHRETLALPTDDYRRLAAPAVIEVSAPH
jgi:hypothetical protein